MGDQTWMAQNLNYACKDSWYYNDDPKNGDNYGRLYKINSALESCPVGWHLPSDEEWQKLQDYTIDYSTDSLNNDLNIVYGGMRRQNYYVELDERAKFWTSTNVDRPFYYRTFKKDGQYFERSLIGSAYGLSVRCIKSN